MKKIKTNKYASVAQSPSDVFLDKIRDIIEISAYGWRGSGDLSEQQALNHVYKMIINLSSFSTQLNSINPQIEGRLKEIKDKILSGIRSPSSMEKQRALLIVSENLILLEDMFDKK